MEMGTTTDTENGSLILVKQGAEAVSRKKTFLLRAHKKKLFDFYFFFKFFVSIFREFSSQYSWEKGPSSKNVSPRNTGILLLILNSLSSV